MVRKASLLIIAVLLFIPNVAESCVGARPLSMGGAFIGVADDANATYWNPAGLVQLEEPEFTYTPTLQNRDQINYDDFVSFVCPIRERGTDWGSLGLSFVNSGFDAEAYRITDRWYWLSYAKSLGFGLSLGLNLRHQQLAHEIRSGWAVLYSNGYVIGPSKDSDDFWAIDPALFWKWDKFSFGLLYQDANEPEVEIFGNRATYIRNLRPGFCFRPDDKTILSLEMYDALGKSDTVERDLRLGMERRFDLPWEGTECALRFGGYHVNSDDKANRAITGGMGYKWKGGDFFLNNKPIPFDISLDYAFMYWTDVSNLGVDEWTHMVGLKISIPWEFSTETDWERGAFYFLPPDPERKVSKETETDSNMVVSNENDDVADKEFYYQRVRQMVMKNILSPAKIEKDTTATVVFLLSSDGKLKQFFIEGESACDPAIKEAIGQVFRNISSFPAFPEDIRKEEEFFKLDISFVN